MTSEEKQEMITKLKLRIAYFEELQISGPQSFSDHQKDTLYFYRIALSALTAQPVKQPQTHDAHGFPEPSHIINSRWIDSISEAGYEVQE